MAIKLDKVLWKILKTLWTFGAHSPTNKLLLHLLLFTITLAVIDFKGPNIFRWLNSTFLGGFSLNSDWNLQSEDGWYFGGGFSGWKWGEQFQLRKGWFKAAASRGQFKSKKRLKEIFWGLKFWFTHKSWFTAKKKIKPFFFRFPCWRSS